MNAVLFIFVLIVPIFGTSPNFDFVANEVPQLEAVFNPQPTGWLGGDSSASFYLRENVYLWLWGDTVIGNLENVNGKTQRNIVTMTHSSIAFADPKSNSSPKYWYPVDKNRNPVTMGVFSPQNPSHSGEYYWLVAGAVGPKSGKLFVIAQTIYDPTPSSFDQLGTDVIIVHNPQEDPARWWYNTSRITGTSDLLSLNTGFTFYDGYFYLVGMYNRSAILARITEDDLVGFKWDSLQYYSTDNTWESKYNKVKLLYPSVYTEGTLQYHTHMKVWFMVSCQAFDSNIYLQTAPNITGPWATRVVYKIPPPYSDANVYLSYAAKSHPEYARENEIIFTYNVNSAKGLAPLVTDMDIYHPKFIKLTIYTNQH